MANIEERLTAEGWRPRHGSDGELVLVRFSDPRIGYKPASGTLIIGYHEHPEKVFSYSRLQRILGGGKRGGARPGAGRPCQGTGRKSAACFMLSPEGAAAREIIRRRGGNVNELVDNFLRRECVAFADSE